MDPLDSSHLEPLDSSYLEPTPSPSPIPDSEDEQRALAASIEKAVRRLRERGRDVVILRDGDVLVLPREVEELPLEQGHSALRYFNAEEHADCVLVLQPRGQRVFACAAYLTLRSDLFKTMLIHGTFSESTTRVINITMPCPAHADTALCFLYTGQLLHSLSIPRLDPADIFGLLENAQYLQSHELAAATLYMLRLCLRNEAAPFYTHIVTDPRFGPDLVPLEWIVAFVRCTPDRSTTDRVRAALAWTRGVDLNDPATLEALAPLRTALDTRIAATSPGEVAALIREFGPALVPLLSADAALVPVLERAADTTRSVLARHRELQSTLSQAQRVLFSMESLTAFRRCERCRVHVPLYLSEDASCTQTYYSGRYFNFSEGRPCLRSEASQDLFSGQLTLSLPCAETRRGGWTCCGATSKTAKGCRGRDCPHRFVEGAETFAGLSRATVPPAVEEEEDGRRTDPVLAGAFISELADHLRAMLTQEQEQQG